MIKRYMDDVSRCTVLPGTLLRDVIACIDGNQQGVALLVDQDRHLLATITDGDIRRSLLRGVNLDQPVEAVLDGRARTQPVTATESMSEADLLHVMNTVPVRQLPILDDNGRVVDLVGLELLALEMEEPVRAVVMAGGFGTRLRPLTNDTPKPMLLVGDRPLLEHTIEQLRDSGISHVKVTTHFCPEKITDHFGEGQDFGVEISYLREDRPLGTAGALGLIEETADTLLVINGDVLTNLDYRAMVAFHRANKADLTVAVRQHEVKVPYGVVECASDRVTGLVEKPTYTYPVNAGIYLVEPSARQAIPADQRMDMTELINTLIAQGRTVVSFPIREYWLDIGQHSDYDKAQLDFVQGRVSKQ